jgi:hypothetical protein
MKELSAFEHSLLSHSNLPVDSTSNLPSIRAEPDSFEHPASPPQDPTQTSLENSEIVYKVDIQPNIVSVEEHRSVTNSPPQTVATVISDSTKKKESNPEYNHHQHQIKPAPTTKRPNVLFILADDLRPQLGVYGHKAVTPNLEKLSAAGITFERAHAQVAKMLCNL